jgi:hypothetical protein
MTPPDIRSFVRAFVPLNIRRAVARARGRIPKDSTARIVVKSSAAMDKQVAFFSLEGRHERLVQNLALITRAAGKGYVPPPKTIPPELLDAFTMSGNVAVIDWYLNSKPDPKSIGSVAMYHSSLIDQIRRGLPEGKYKSYGKTNDYLRDALSVFQIQGMYVLICGSAYPQYESFCLNAGGYPVTIEYNVRFSDLSTLAFFTPTQFAELGVKGDAAIAISSFEHDGLGRYGDPLDPDGDLKAMRRLREQIEPGAFAFVSVPLGRDAVVWNAHRIYGYHRLPRLFHGWEILRCFGDPCGLINTTAGGLIIDRQRWDQHFPSSKTGPEWVFVLRRN